MRHRVWLWIALAGCLACGTSTRGLESETAPSADDDEDDDSESSKTTVRDSGARARDAGQDAGADIVSGAHDSCSSAKNISVTGNSPDVLIVLDRSGSMITGMVQRWAPSASAVKALTTALTDTVGFGLMLFPAPGSMSTGLFGRNETACTPGQVDVPVDLQTAEAIATALDGAAPERTGQTPTAATLTAALGALNMQCADCSARSKYVLLVTDGQPNCGANSTTTQTRPEDVSETDTAIDALMTAGIKTFVVGYDTANDPALADTLDEFAQHGGTDKHFAVMDEASLVAEFTNIVGRLIPCEYALESQVDDPALLRVTIDGTTYEQGTDWNIVDDKLVLHEQAAACTTLRDAQPHRLKITSECAAAAP